MYTRASTGMSGIVRVSLFDSGGQPADRLAGWLSVGQLVARSGCRDSERERSEITGSLFLAGITLRESENESERAKVTKMALSNENSI